jgi:hypothetical protein
VLVVLVEQSHLYQVEPQEEPQVLLVVVQVVQVGLMLRHISEPVVVAVVLTVVVFQVPVVPVETTVVVVAEVELHLTVSQLKVVVTVLVV